MTMTSKDVYLHEGQLKFLTLPQKTKVAVCGRGWGKTTEIAAILKEMVREMPGAFIAYVALSFGQVKNLSLGAIQKALKKEGFKKNIHYVVGVRPPKKLNFKVPDFEIEDYTNIITFYNGFTINLISSNTKDVNRGGSYDAVIFDEACFFKESFYKDIIKPSIRGYKNRFLVDKNGIPIPKDAYGRYTSKGTPSRWYLSQTILSSRARNGEGTWVYNFKKKAEEKPDKFAYYEESARANIHALGGEEWFEEQLDSLGALVYAIEIENEDLQRLPDGYYSSFDPNRNTYTPSGDGFGDIDKDRLISLSFDFGGWFTCASLYQEVGGVEYKRREFFVKQNGTLDGLIREVIIHLSDQRFKLVDIYGDPSGYSNTPFSEVPAYKTIANAFHAAGWQTNIKADKDYNKLLHKDRRDFMNMSYSEESALYPRIKHNAIACPNSVIAIGLTDVNPDGSKNKTKEKDRTYPQQHAPHLTDTDDYYIVPKYRHRLTNSNRRPGQVWS